MAKKNVEEPVSAEVTEEVETAPEVEAVDYEQKLATLEAELAHQKDVYLRMLAEYDNYRKRSIADTERARIAGVSAALKAIFPVIDSINRAIEVLAGEDKALSGIVAIKKQFEQSLGAIGVEQIKALGEEFDPEYHNAVMQEENPDMAGKITQVFQEGYKYKEYVIRPSMVKVAV